MRKVLIIEDDEVLLRLLGATLAAEGYSVVKTADGPQGITLYQEHRPDLVLLDLGLPTISGIEVLRKLRQFDQSAKVIVVTGYGSVESAVLAIRSGASDYLQKPINIDALLNKVNSVLHLTGG